MVILSPTQISRFESQDDIDAVLALTKTDVEIIDDWLMSFASDQFQKVSMLIINAIRKSDQENIFTSIPDVYFGIRVEALVKKKLLQGAGDLSNLRHSEVKLEK